MRTGFRPATPADVPFILGLLREFYEKAGGIYKIEFCESSTLNTIALVIERGVCLVGPSSCAGAILAPFDYNYHAIIANVAFWYFRSAREIVILDALMEACRGRGATHIAVASQFPKHAIARRYKKMGFTFCEQKALIAL